MAKKVRYAYSDKYFNDYDQLRPFLRFISYGCFHKEDYKRLAGFSSSFYDMELKFARYALSADKIMFCQNHHQRVHMLRGDSYHICNNFLAASYGMKKLSPRVMFFLCGLLQLLGKYRDFDINSLPVEFCTMELPSPDHKDEIVYWDSVSKDFKAALKLLVDEGYIFQSGTRKKRRYNLCPAIWKELSDSEAEELYFAIGVYRNMTLLAMPGYNLAAKLVDANPALKDRIVPCQFKNAAFSRIIDDEVIEGMLLAAENKSAVDFCYTNSIYPRKNGRKTSRRNVFPIGLRTDFLDGGRQYVLTGKAKGIGNSRESFRVEAISDLKVKRLQEAELKGAEERKAKAVRVRFHIAHEAQGVYKRRILDFEPEAECLEQDDDGFVYEFYGYDEWRIIPFVRRFFPYAEVLSPQRLRDKIGRDIGEALSNYGVIQ